MVDIVNLVVGFIVFITSGQHITWMSLNICDVITVYLIVLVEFSYGGQGHSLVSFLS